MRAVGAGILLIVTGFAGQAHADDATALFKKYKCTKCHATDSRLETAPSYNEIMAKYKGKADAQAQLAKVVKDGGSDVWGETRMPANPYIPDADVAAMVTWILKH
jgi:cytochrome c551/c552